MIKILLAAFFLLNSCLAFSQDHQNCLDEAAWKKNLAPMVEKLGEDEWTIRESAQKELSKLAKTHEICFDFRAALNRLVEKTLDPEIQWRLKDIESTRSILGVRLEIDEKIQANSFVTVKMTVQNLTNKTVYLAPMDQIEGRHDGVLYTANFYYQNQPNIFIKKLFYLLDENAGDPGAVAIKPGEKKIDSFKYGLLWAGEYQIKVEASRNNFTETERDASKVALRAPAKIEASSLRRMARDLAELQEKTRRILEQNK